MTRYRDCGPCMCGATDCPSCGPAQGYTVIRVWDPEARRWVWRNPEDVEDGDEIDLDEEEPYDVPSDL